MGCIKTQPGIKKNLLKIFVTFVHARTHNARARASVVLLPRTFLIMTNCKQNLLALYENITKSH